MANVGKGLGAIKDAMNKSAVNLKIKSGESAVVRILTPADEIISVWEHTEEVNGQWTTHTCLGKNQGCPWCLVGKKPSFKSYLVVADRNDSDKVKLFKASKKVGVQLLGLVEEYGDLTKRDFKIFRQGEKLETTYQFFPRDPAEFKLAEGVELPDVEDMVQPLSAEAIKRIMDGDVGSVSDVPPTDAPAGNQGNAPAGGQPPQDDYPF